MPISVSDHLKISVKNFDATGAFDAILDVDSKLSIDPHLLKGTRVPELRGSYAKLEKRFEQILTLLSHSKRYGDAMWRSADKLFTFPELRGTCIGYSAHGTDGSGMGPELRARVLATAKEIINVGVTAPEIFELVGVFEKDIGPDRISDMVGRIIGDDLLKYTERVLKSLDAKPLVSYRDYKTILNPFNGFPLILVPRSILRDLPIANSWDEIDIVCRHNAALRERLNEIIGDTWKKATRQKKDTIKRVVLENGEVLKDLIESYKAKPGKEYDFEKDPAGEFIWKRASENLVSNFPLALTLDKKPTQQEVLDVVLRICAKFKDLVENNAIGGELLYVEKGKPKHEAAAQKLFYGIADCHCEANDLDLTAEANAGRGPCDFKISSGYGNRVVVETKLTSNNQLIHGFEKQIREYGKAEKTKTLIYLVIDVDGAPVSRVQELKDLIEREKKTGSMIPTVIFVDARSKKSASKI